MTDEHACEASAVDRHILVELEPGLDHARRAALWYSIALLAGVQCQQAFPLADIRPDRLWVYDPKMPAPRLRR